MAYTITRDNYLEANAAVRDILYMYRDLIISYAGFGHGIDTGTFDACSFVDVEIDEETADALGIDVSLIHQGSAVALLCGISDFWDENGHEKPRLRQWGKNWYSLLEPGKFDHLPTAKKAFLAGLESEDELRLLLPTVYTEYVEGYFHRLLQKGS